MSNQDLSYCRECDDCEGNDEGFSLFGSIGSFFSAIIKLVVFAGVVFALFKYGSKYVEKNGGPEKVKADLVKKKDKVVKGFSQKKEDVADGSTGSPFVNEVVENVKEAVEATNASTGKILKAVKVQADKSADAVKEVKKEVVKLAGKVEESKPLVVSELPNFGDDEIAKRRVKLVKHLSKKGAATMTDLSDIVPDVSRRTLRRDMNYLEKRGFIKQEGSTSNVNYVYIQG